ncbi:MAG: tRNA (adenosine(37)-N6)-threonylcarbamoyltransferase complex transferase subunit TsaD [Patescibacteria group bacterium]|nr:tRNA (adenosine(37)-N6)-threonylcarbamoyltransferase complex transferase subunit TsaD [Patescibacteria group bacterium]
MKILAIETSCDETSAAIVENGAKILSNVVSSSVKIHAKIGGIIPEIAAREQLKAIIPVIKKAFASAHLKPTDIDAVAVTSGPGLIGSLLIGVETAKTLAYVWNKPLIPVNHLKAHIYANWLGKDSPTFPNVALLVSGGHTDLILMKTYGKFKWLGGTKDDAAGEAFDKIARLLNLGYPGGPMIAKAAESGDKNTYPLPRPMINSPDLDFSFSGLKTAVLNKVKLLTETKPFSPTQTSNLAAATQAAVVDVLVSKTIHAAKKYKVKEILLAGGVAANKLLRKEMAERFEGKVLAPPVNLCTDNAAIVAACAYFNYQPKPWQKIKADPSLHF